MRLGSLAGLRSWKATLTLASAVTLTVMGCGKEDSASDLRPEGPPEILQVFVIDGDGTSKLAYGDHPDITGRAEDPPDLVPSHADQAGPVENAVVSGNRIRIVLDELLRASTVEQFVCACAAGGCTTIGHTFDGTEVDPEACTSCADDPATPLPLNETGRCSDANLDGVPDDAILQAAVVTLSCQVADVVSGENDGWYNPSGNQQIPTQLGTNALGPALVLNPPLLPTNADCTVVIATSVVDKDGVAVPAVNATFHTEPMLVIASSPPDGASGISTVDFTAAITFNTELDGASAGNVTVDVGGTDVPGTAMLDPMDPSTILWTPAAALTADTDYTVTVETTVTDVFGSALPAVHTFTFTTGT